MLNSNVAGIVWKTTPIGESQSTSTHKTIAKIHDIIMADRQVMEHYIATKLGISQDRIHAVIYNELHMSKVSVHCVPKLLGPVLKETRFNMSKGNLVIFRQIPTVFFRYLWLWITPGSIRPETKQQSKQWKQWKQWKHLGSPPPKETKTGMFAGNVMASMFWDAEGVLLVDYLDKGHTITGANMPIFWDSYGKNIRQIYIYIYI